MSFSENEIRPNIFDDGKWDAINKDIEFLKSNKNKFVETSCPACSSNNRVFEFEKYTFNFDRCLECGTIYMNPRANSSLLNKFYEKSATYDYWNKYIYPASRGARIKNIFMPRIERLINQCNLMNMRTPSLCEIGAGSGMFCEAAQKANYFSNVTAIEPSKSQAETCESYGITTLNESLETMKDKEMKFDIVASFETLEHVFSPKEFLMKCAGLLNSKGLLILSMPNYEGFDIQCLGKLSESLDAEHINLFNTESIKLLLETTGFEVLSLETPGELDFSIVMENKDYVHPALKNLLNSLNRKSQSDKGFSKELQDFLKRWKLSSHMLMICKLR